MDATLIVDVFYIAIASVCAGFVVYGGWLCLDKRGTASGVQNPSGSVVRPDSSRSML
jgi:hypothetical protein